MPEFVIAVIVCNYSVVVYISMKSVQFVLVSCCLYVAADSV